MMGRDGVGGLRHEAQNPLLRRRARLCSADQIFKSRRSETFLTGQPSPSSDATRTTLPSRPWGGSATGHKYALAALQGVSRLTEVWNLTCGP